MAHALAGWAENSADFELLDQPPFNLVCFRHKSSDDFNKKLMAKLNKTGKIFLTHTVLNGKFWLRMSIGQTQTTMEHVENAWKLIQQIAKN